MSELGNKIKTLRKGDTLKEFAERVGLSWSMIAKIEKGDNPSKETVSTIAHRLKLSQADYADLLRIWVKAQLGDDAKLLWIDPKKESELIHESNNIPLQIQTLAANLPDRLQHQVLLALQRPEIIRSIEHLNNLHDRLAKGLQK
jgi:transcriptional regulator with XRE-family HTH domain